MEEKNVHDPLINLELWGTLASALGFTGEQRISQYVPFPRSCATLYVLIRV
jgi:hypothetical protein